MGCSEKGGPVEKLAIELNCPLFRTSVTENTGIEQSAPQSPSSRCLIG